MRRDLIAVSAFLCSTLGTSLCFAANQNKPFPTKGGYPNGFVPTTITSDDAMASYNHWKATYLKTDCGSGTARVEFGSPQGSTVSEGQGYGMVISVYFGDQAAFDGLWKFVQKNLNPNGLMGWKETCSGFVTGEGGGGSATDGDTDIGFALVAAVDQWGDTYRQTALDYLATLKKVDYGTCKPSGRNMAKNGDWAGCDHSNTSYWMPGYYRVFQEFTGDAYWGKAADDAIALDLADRNASTGLIANEVNQDGTTYGSAVVDYNGCRVPWRVVLDYLWYGTAGAKDVTDKITDWASPIGISKLVDGYNTDGTPSPSGRNTQIQAWVGGWSCGAMSKSQSDVDGFAADLKSIDVDNGTYYGSSLRTLYMLMLSGNFWKPGSPPVSGSSGSGSSGSGSSGSASSGGSSGSGSSGAGSGQGAAPAAGSGSGSSGGCGCRTAPGGGDAAGVAALLALGLVFARRQRRAE
jgi:MYXO-CTERM domain-containing protein